MKQERSKRAGVLYSGVILVMYKIWQVRKVMRTRVRDERQETSDKIMDCGSCWDKKIIAVRVLWVNWEERRCSSQSVVLETEIIKGFSYWYDQRSWGSIDDKITEWIEVRYSRGQSVGRVMYIDIETTQNWYEIRAGGFDTKQRFLRNG